MGGKDGNPGGGVPANQLWWRIPLFIIALSILPAILCSISYFGHN